MNLLSSSCKKEGNDFFIYFFASYLFCLRVLGLFIFFERDRTIRDSISTLLAITSDFFPCSSSRLRRSNR
jgi:hypothetical protein